MTITTQEVEIRSYAIWEQEGCPHGRDLEFWLRAEAELAEEAQASADAPEAGLVEAAPKGKSKTSEPA